jgi:hypothetical protein
MKALLMTGLMVGLLSVGGLQAETFGDWLKRFGAFDFGGPEFDPSQMQGNERSWEDRERWVSEALENAYQTLARADEEVSLFDFQNYINVLSIEWAPDYLTDPANIGNLNAYATFTEYLSRYLKVKQELITAIADLNSNYAILTRVDPKQLTGPFQLGPQNQNRTLTEKAAGTVDATAAEMALATSAGAVEKYTAELNRAIDYGLKLEQFFRRAVNMEPAGAE